MHNYVQKKKEIQLSNSLIIALKLISDAISFMYFDVTAKVDKNITIDK